MIEVLKTSDGKVVCEQKLISCIKENKRCILIVDSDNFDLAVYLKNKHILMDTYIKDCFYKEGSLIYTYPNVKVLLDNEFICESDLINNNFFLGISDFDIERPDDYTKTILELQKKIYFSESFVETQYALIICPKKTFCVSKNSSSKNLIENNTLYLYPTDSFKGKSDYAIVPFHSISVLIHTYGDSSRETLNTFFSELYKFLVTKNINVCMCNNDLFINNKKFFSGGINYLDSNKVIHTATGIFSLITEFKPVEYYFHNIMKYNGKNKYTGFLEETPSVNYIDIFDSIKNILIKITNK